MRSTDRRLLIVALALSLLLTALTVWSVVRQGQALQAREWSDLVNEAQAAAARRSAELHGDVQRALDMADLTWRESGLDGLDAWAGSQSDWTIVGVRDADGTFVALPRTPLQPPFVALPHAPTQPASRGALTGPGSPEETRDAAGALSYFQRLATTTDPLLRAAALLAAAAAEQQLGRPLAAARLSAEAAQVLRDTPGMARFAFRAEIERIESLLAAGVPHQARENFRQLVEALVGDHPGRLGDAEATRLTELATRLGAFEDSTVEDRLDVLTKRAAQRTRLVDAAQRLLGVLAGGDDRTLHVETIPGADGTPLYCAARATEEGAVCVAVPATRLLARYWRVVDTDASWRMQRLPDDTPALVDLGPEFAGAVLVPGPDAAYRLRAAAQRRLGLVALVALGSLGAWALVLWMFSRAMRRQRELVRIQGRLVADVSHELKTPLALIRLLAETLAVQRVRDPDKVRSYCETITRESERLTVLLDSILDFSRMESGRKQYQFGECDVARVARQAWLLFEPQFVRDGFETHLEIASHLPLIRADAQALQQVIVNLLQNAHRYAGEGKYVRLAVRREGYLIVIFVEDHGIGMTRTQLEHLGDSFVRGDDTRVRQTRGTGLGLAIVNHIVTAHQGKLEVDSRPSRGSTFTVWIPFEPVEGTEAEATEPPAEATEPRSHEAT